MSTERICSTLAPVCRICLATVYSEWGPNASGEPYDDPNHWLSAVRVIANVQNLDLPSQLLGVVDLVPNDEEDFGWDQDILLTPPGVVTSWTEYDSNNATLTWKHLDADGRDIKEEFTLDNGIFELLFVHESCYEIFVSFLTQFSKEHGILGNCSARCLWEWLSAPAMNEESAFPDECVPSVEQLSYGAPRYVAKEEEKWKWINPLSRDPILQRSTENAFEVIARVLETRDQRTTVVSPTTSEPEVDWKARTFSEIPWMLSHLSNTFSDTKLNWKTLYYFLSSFSSHTETLFTAPFIEAPSLRNRIRISRRISALVPDLWRREVVRRNENAKLPLWQRNCFTIGMSSRGFKDVFFHNSDNDLSFNIQGFLRPNALLAGILFETTKAKPSTTPQILGSESSYLGASIKNCVLSKIRGESSKGKVICGVVISVEKRLSPCQNAEDYLEGVVGLKFVFEDNSQSPIFGCWIGNSTQYLRPGKDNIIVGLRYCMIANNYISSLVLIEANLNTPPKSHAAIKELYISSPPLLRYSWPRYFPPKDIIINKAIGMDNRKCDLNRADIVIFDPSDPITLVRKQVPHLEFISLAGKKTIIPSSGIFDAASLFEINVKRGERIIGFICTYDNIYDSEDELPIMEDKNFLHGYREDPKLVDIQIKTNWGRISEGKALEMIEWKISRRYKFDLTAEEEEQIAGLYYMGGQEHLIGLLTRKK